MRSLNESVLTPLFLVPFFASPLLSAAATLALATEGTAIAATLLGVATGTQIFGVILITIAMNVPLKDHLARTNAAAEGAWAAFSSAWQRAHRLRTTTSCLAPPCCAGAWWARSTPPARISPCQTHPRNDPPPGHPR